MSTWEVATITTSGHLRVHLDAFREDKVTPLMLERDLSIATDVVESALGLPENRGFLSEVYTAAVARWGGHLAVPVTGSSEPEWIPLRPAEDAPWEEQFDNLQMGAELKNDAFKDWSLPKRDLVVPFSTDAFCGLHNYAKGDSAAHVCVDVPQFIFPTSDIGELNAAVGDLNAAIEKREEAWAEEAQYFAALKRVDGVLRLQSRAWESVIDTRRGAADRIGEIGKARKLVADIYVRGAAKLAGDEDDLADRVLKLLGRPGLVAAAERIALQSSSVDGPGMSEIATLLGWAAGALARSSRASKFAIGCIGPALVRTCERETDDFKLAMDRLRLPPLDRVYDGDWLGTLADIRSRLAAEQEELDTAFKPLSAVAKYYKGGTSTLIAGLSEATIMALWDHLHGPGGPSVKKTAAWLFRATVTRGIPSSVSKDLMVGGKISVRALRKELKALGQPATGADWRQRAAIFKKLEAGNRVLRTPGLVGLNYILSALTFAMADIGGDPDEAVERMLATATAGIGMTSATLQTIEMLAGHAKAIAASRKYMGRLAVVLSTVSIAMSARKRIHNPSLGSVAPDLLALEANALTMGGWVHSWIATSAPWLKGASPGVVAQLGARAAALGIAGAVLGFAAMVWALLDKPDIPETLGVYEKYWRFARSSLVIGGQRDEVEDLERLLSEKKKPLLFTGFAGPKGDVGGWKRSDPPTWFAAQSLGFNAHEIAQMFSVDVDDVAKAGIDRSLRGSTKPGGGR